MWRFKNYPDMYRLVTPLVNSGLMAKPAWYDAIRMSPPTQKIMAPKPPTIELPEQKLYDKLLLERPMLELEEEEPMEPKRTVAHRFAIKQLNYMEKERLSEKEAFEKCEKEFAPDIAAFEAKLDRIHQDGGKKESFYQIQTNMTRHARTASTIAILLEKRLLNSNRLGRWERDIDDKNPTPRRTAAKLDRIMHDPAVRMAKEMFSVHKPPVLRALENLINEPNSVDRSFYEKELRNYVRSLQSKVFAAERDPSYTEAVQKEFSDVRRNLQRIAPELNSTPRFLDLSASNRIATINAVQSALRHKLFPSVDTARVAAETQHVHAVRQMVQLQRELADESATRTILEIEIAHAKAGQHREMQWWYSSPERKDMLERAARMRDRLGVTPSEAKAAQ